MVLCFLDSINFERNVFSQQKIEQLCANLMNHAYTVQKNHTGNNSWSSYFRSVIEGNSFFFFFKVQ